MRKQRKSGPGRRMRGGARRCGGGGNGPRETSIVVGKDGDAVSVRWLAAGHVAGLDSAMRFYDLNANPSHLQPQWQAKVSRGRCTGGAEVSNAWGEAESEPDGEGGRRATGTGMGMGDRDGPRGATRHAGPQRAGAPPGPVAVRLAARRRLAPAGTGARQPAGRIKKGREEGKKCSGRISPDRPSSTAGSSGCRPCRSGRSAFPGSRCVPRCLRECSRGFRARCSPARSRSRRCPP